MQLRKIMKLFKTTVICSIHVPSYFIKFELTYDNKNININ